MKQKILWAAIGAVLASPAGPGAVTLDDYLARVRETHPMFASESMRAEVESTRRKSLAGTQDWVLESSPSFFHSEPPVSSPFEPERIDRLELDAGASRAFWDSGTRLSVGWSSVVLDQKLPGIVIPSPGGFVDVPIGPSTYYTHTLTATVSIPLLRNRGGKLDRLDYDLAAYDVEAVRVDAAENQETFLFDAAMKYLDWVLAAEQERIALERLDLAKEELERTRRKRRSYLVDEADVLRAEDAVQVVESALQQVRAARDATHAELVALAGWSDDAQGSPSFDIYARPEAPPKDAIPAVVASTRGVRALAIRREQAAALAGGLGDMTRPDLAAVVSGSLVGGDNELDRSLEITHPDILVGLEFRHPLGTRTASAELEQARLEARRLELAQRGAETTLTAALESVVTRMQHLDTVLDLNQRRIDTARRKTAEELDLYNQGRGDLTFVIQSRDNEAQAKLEYAANALLYHRLMLQYRALSDTLLDEEAN